MEPPAQPETPTENIALITSSVSGTVAYVLVLREYYSWWVVVPVTLLALPVAMIVAALVLNFAGTTACRLIFLSLVGLLLWTAATAREAAPGGSRKEGARRRRPPGGCRDLV